MSPSSGAAPKGVVTIRTAGPDDARAIDDMVAALAAHLDVPSKKTSSPHDIRAALTAEPPLVNGLIADYETGPVGLCLWFPWFSSWRGSPSLFVLDLYVAPSARGSGLARLLLSVAAGEGRGFGVRFIRLGVDRANLPAIAFYDRIGFEPVENEQVLDLSGPCFDDLLATTGLDGEQQQPDQSDRS